MFPIFFLKFWIKKNTFFLLQSTENWNLKKNVTTTWWTKKDLEIFKVMKMSQNGHSQQVSTWGTNTKTHPPHMIVIPHYK